MNRFPAFLILFCTLAYSHLVAQSGKADEGLPVMDNPISVTEHRIEIGGEQINYTATTGYMMLKSESGKPRAYVFFMAYSKNGVTDPANRPITFSFNGGPGSSSVWLHMGALGPKRIVMTDEGEATEPPYEYVDNEFSWLDQTDLVFIDPVMTGYSRPAEGVDKKEFLGYNEDIRSVGQFIYNYTSKYERWNSPKYLAGESYGTTRAAGLSGHLQDRYGMYLNGIVMISAVTNFQTIRFHRGNELPYAMFLPTYAATAWYHGKLDSAFTSLPALLAEVKNFANGEYSFALMKGDQLSPEVKKLVIDKLHRYTGLSKTYIEETHLRINIFRFTKELLREKGETVGRLDSRIKAVDYDRAGESFEFDPSLDGAISGPYTMAINDYIRRELKFTSELSYEILTGRVQPWSYKNVQNRYLNVSETLRKSMSKNPSLKVLICNGYYDLATPFFATEYTVDHMFLDPALRNNIQLKYYEAGHMMYIHKPSLEQMTKDVRAFYEGSN